MPLFSMYVMLFIGSMIMTILMKLPPPFCVYISLGFMVGVALLDYAILLDREEHKQKEEKNDGP